MCRFYAVPLLTPMARCMTGVAVLAFALGVGVCPPLANAADPAGAPNDPFFCYKARRDSGAPRLDPLFFLPVEDPLASSIYDIRKRRGLCNPADREGAGIVDPITHMLSYGLRESATAPDSVKHDVLVLDQFGILALTTARADRLLIPSALDPNAPVAPLDPESHVLDRLLCHRARVTKGAPKFPKDVQTSVVDEFGEPVLLDVKKPQRLCFPASVDGSAITNPTGHLSCYKVKRAKGELSHEKQSGLHANNEFEDVNPDGPAVLKTSRREELCIPAVVVPQPTACDLPASDGGPTPDLCSPPAPTGSEFYVATDGSDLTGDGSDLTPWATISHAVLQVADGSTILVRPGTYLGRVELDASFPTGIVIRSEVPYMAQLRHDSTVVTAFTGQGITLEGFDIAHDGTGASPLVVHIQDLRGEPGDDDFTRRITLRNNVIHDSFNNDILKINNGASEVIVEGNLFYNQQGDDEHVDMNSTTNITIRDNVFFNDFAGSGRIVGNDTSNFVVVKDTTLGGDLNFGSADIGIWRNVFANWEGLIGAYFVLVGNDEQTYFGAHDVVVENNLLLGNTANEMRSGIGANGARCVEVNHNTVAGDLPSFAFALRANSEGSNPPNEELYYTGNVWSDPTGTMEDFSDSPEDETLSFVLDTNLYWNGGLAIPVDPAETINVTDDAGAVLGDPLLPAQAGLIPPVWDALSGTFADGSTTICEVHTALVTQYGVPSAGSAVVDAGDPAVAPDHDILGQPRPVGDGPDLGAVELP